MKRFVSIIIAGAMMASLCGCGCSKKEEEKSHIVKKPGVVATAVPKSDTIKETEPASSPAGTVEPLEDSTEVITVGADEVPTVETSEEFEAEVPSGHKRFSSGDDSWGIELPENAEIEDQSESSAMFKIGSNIVTAVIVDRVTKLETVEQVKEYYSDFGEIAIDEFTVIRDDGEYIGCYFEYLTQDRIRGFAKYVVNDKRTVSAAAVNITMDAAQNEILRETVNSLVIFE